MIEIPWLQLSGAITGGLVGSFSGFIANSFHERRVRVRVRRNIACALVGEIGALSDYIANNYLALLRASLDTAGDQPEHPAHFFRGDRDYMPVFRSIPARRSAIFPPRCRAISSLGTPPWRPPWNGPTRCTRWRSSATPD